MSRARSVMRHVQNGTLLDAVRRRLTGPSPDTEAVRWSGTADLEEAASVLEAHARAFVDRAPTRAVITAGDGGPLQQALESRLARSRVGFRSLGNDDVLRLSDDEARQFAGVLCCHVRTAPMTHLAGVLASRPALADLPFEYVAGLDPERDVFAALDEYRDTWFVSPVLLEDPTPYRIYRDSLDRFEQKCGLRDYLDLYQLLKSVVERNIPGDIAEFGSYRGHSGWLIARTLETLESDKSLFMFDTFDAFPDEPLGVDHFWSGTHGVDFDVVRERLAGFEHVRLVKGDFTRTLETSELGTVALAYVDCDSYRATRFLIDALLPGRIAPGGVLVCEDYGHPALLGNRVAVHESLPDTTNSFRFFSQFSGLYVVVKL